MASQRVTVAATTRGVVDWSTALATTPGQLVLARHVMHTELFLIEGRTFKGFRSVLSATNAKGVGVLNCDTELCALYSTTPIADEEEVWVETYRAGKLQDVYFSFYLLVSAPLHQLLTSFRTDNYFRWLPAHVHDERKKLLGEMMLGYTDTRIDAVDYANSEPIYFKGTTDIRDIAKYEFFPEKLPPLDLFWTRQGKWIATRPLVEAMNRSRAVGYVPTPIWSGEVPD